MCIVAWTLALPISSMAHPLASTLADASLPVIGADDLALARDCLGVALDEDDGVVHAWTNARSGDSGTVTAIRSFNRDGVECRDFEVTFQWVSGNRREVWKLCQFGDRWRLLGTG